MIQLEGKMKLCLKELISIEIPSSSFDYHKQGLSQQMNQYSANSQRSRKLNKYAEVQSLGKRRAKLVSFQILNPQNKGLRL